MIYQLEESTTLRTQKEILSFAINTVNPEKALMPYIKSVVGALKRRKHKLLEKSKELNFVLNLIDIKAPGAYRRKRPEEFVISIGIMPSFIKDIRAKCYEILVKTLSNLFFGIVPAENDGVGEVYYITPEVGFVHFPFQEDKIIQCMNPVIHAHLVLRNRLNVNLPPSITLDIPEVNQIIYYGKELDKLGLLPSPFSIRELLTEDLARSIYKLYRIKGLSYGNLSIRGSYPGIAGTTFWMSARGVNKGKLQGIGKDILLVSGYDREAGKMVVSIPPDHDPTVRVSVDAVEHFLIYEQFPDVGAIVHVHAWMDGILCTTQNYPCGSKELAQEVVHMLHETNNPNQAEIGLKNHGMTITGYNLEEIFDRIGNRLHTKVPMFE